MTDVPEWTAGVCGDGAVFLRDGKPMTIAEVLEFLNDREKLCLKWVQLMFACGYPMPAELEQCVLPKNPYQCGICAAHGIRGTP